MKQTRERDRWYRDAAFVRKLLRFTLPIALQSLMLASVAAADALMLGSVSQNAMSAVSLATQIQFIQNVVLSAAVAALTILGAQYWGKGNIPTLSRLFFMAARFCGAASVAVFVLCVFFPGYLMLLFTDVPELIAIGVRYLRIAGWSYLLTGVSQCYLALMKVSDHARETAVVSTGAVLINIALNAVFIFGIGFVPAMGVEGAALATLVSRVAELAWVVLISFKKGYICPDFAEFVNRSRELAASFRKCMLPILGASLFWSVGFTSYTAFMGHLGEDAAAANAVAAVVRDLVCCMCNGIGYGGAIVVGNELGAGNLERGRLYGGRLVRISFFCGFVSTAFMLATTPLILAFVQLTEGAKSLLLGMMVIMAFYMIGRSVNTVVINGVFSAGGDTMFDMYSLAVSMWCIAIPLAAAGTFAFGWPVLVVYACTCLDEVGKIPWVLHHYRKYKWVKDLTIKTPDDAKQEGEGSI